MRRRFMKWLMRLILIIGKKIEGISSGCKRPSEKRISFEGSNKTSCKLS
jgi:hypothetical protein